MTDIGSFVKEMRARVTDALCAVGPGVQRVQTAHTFQAGEATIITLRGGLIEKANITLMNLKDVAMPGTTEKVDPTVFQVEVFPENPYCPMGHFNTEWTRPGVGPYYMNLDLFPAVRVEEDLMDMRKAMDGVADLSGPSRVPRAPHTLDAVLPGAGAAGVGAIPGGPGRGGSRAASGPQVTTGH